MVPLLQNISVEYVPQVGYLVVVAQADAHLLTGNDWLTDPHPFSLTVIYDPILLT